MIKIIVTITLYTKYLTFSLFSDIYQFAKESTLVSNVLPISLSNDHWGDMKGTFQDDKIRCYAHIAAGNSFGMRINTLQAYALINREVG